MPWARASALDRHLACPAASWLPRADRGAWRQGYLTPGELVAPGPAPQEDTTLADWGTAMHAAKAGTGCDPWMSTVDPWREQLWPSRLGQHEVCVSYDCRTWDVELGPAGALDAEADAWKASRGPDCVVGTADWLGELPSGEIWVDDLKTGWRRPDPATNSTLFYLMVWAKIRKRLLGWTSICWWPRGADTVPSREGLWRKVTAVALDALEDDLHRAWLGAIGHSRNDPQWRPEPRPGPHCSYCPSAAVCPRANE